MSKKPRKVRAALAAMLLGGALAITTACTPPQGHETAAGKPKVLTTFTVIADIARNVAGDHLDVQSITKPDQEIHEYEPTPEDVKKAEGAQLILNNGLGLERWFEKFVASAHAKSALLSEGVTSIPIAEGDYQGKPNPHAWMSGDMVKIYVDNMVKAFSELDPKHSDDYAANAKKYKSQIDQVTTKMQQELATVPEKQRVLVSCEGAFSYLARDMGLTEKYLWGVNAEGALTPQRVADVETYVKDNKVPAVFCESTVGDKMQPVVEATGAKFGGTLYVDSLSGPDGDVPTYLDLLRYDAELITKGLTGKADATDK